MRAAAAFAAGIVFGAVIGWLSSIGSTSVAVQQTLRERDQLRDGAIADVVSARHSGGDVADLQGRIVQYRKRRAVAERRARADHPTSS